jgi:hypothetical protein
MNRFALLAVPLVAIACAQQPPVSPPVSPPASAPSPQGACNAEPAQFAVGRAQTASLVEEVRQKSGAHIARILRPGQVVTMEFSGERVNVEVDAANRIVRVRCG